MDGLSSFSKKYFHGQRRNKENSNNNCSNSLRLDLEKLVMISDNLVICEENVVENCGEKIAIRSQSF